MKSLDVEFLAGDDAVLVHEAGAVGSDNVFCTGFDVAHDFVASHLAGYGMFFNGKHAAEAAAFVGAFGFDNLYVTDEGKEIAQFVMVRHIALGGGGEMEQAHAMATVLDAHLVGETDVERGGADDVVDELADFVDFPRGLAGL